MGHHTAQFYLLYGYMQQGNKGTGKQLIALDVECHNDSSIQEFVKFFIGYEMFSS